MASNLISRGFVMLDYLDRLGRKDSYKAKFEALCEAVDNAPAVDAVEVVRCKDCVNRGDDIKCPLCTRDCNWNDDDGCFEWDYYDETEDDGFCHKGVKRDAVD